MANMDKFTEEHVGKALDQGEKNQRTAQRVQNWCRNARIKSLGGAGMLEKMTGLPIGHMGVECDHASEGGPMCWDLEEAAVDFYLRNCENCDKREPGIGPDIEPLVRNRKEAEATRAQENIERQKLETLGHAELKLKLDSLRTSEGQETNQIVDLIEAVERDEDGNSSDKLVEFARLAPEAFPPAVVEFLKDRFIEGDDKLATPAIRTLLELPIEPEAKLELAVRDASDTGVCESSAKYLENAAAELSPENVNAVLRSLTLRAFPMVGLGYFVFQSDDAPLLALVSHHGEVISKTLKEWLASGEEYLVDNAVRAIFVIAHAHPALVKPFLREVFGKLLRHDVLLPGFSDEARDSLSVLMQTTARLFCAFPDAADEILEILLRGSGENARSEGAQLYSRVLYEWDGDPDFTPGNAQEIAFKRILWMAAEISEGKLNEEAIQFFPSVREQLLPIAAKNVEEMLGVAATFPSKIELFDEESAVEVPKTGLEGLDAVRRSQQRSLIYSFQENLLAWAFAASARQDRAAVIRILDFYVALPENQVEMRANMVKYFSGLMGKHEYVNLVLSHVYTAMTSPEPLVRGSAATAVGKAPYGLRRDFPELLFEVYIVLLSDPDVYVHQSAVHALNIHDFPENLKPRLAHRLVSLIRDYVHQGNEDSFVVQCLKHYALGCLTDTQLSGSEGHFVVGIISQLEERYACEAVTVLGYSLKDLPDFVKLCAKILQGKKIYKSNRKERMFRLLDGIPRERLREASDEFADTARSFADTEPHRAGPIIELLAKAGCWAEATCVCEHILTTIPDTLLNRGIRLHFEGLRQVCAFESARPTDGISIDDAEATWSKFLEDEQNDNPDPNAENLFQKSFSSRLSAFRALERADADMLHSEASEIRNISARFRGKHLRTELAAFSDTLDCLAMAQRWINAVRDAETDSIRFWNSCRLRAEEALRERTADEPAALDPVLTDIAETETPSLDSLADLKLKVIQTSLPFGMWPEPQNIMIPEENFASEVPQIEVAFVKFEINGRPAREIDALTPNTIYDIGIQVRVSRWPDSADRLIVTPVSMEPSGTYEMPIFIIERPNESNGEDSLMFHKTGRLLLKVPVAFGAHPFEFKYRAVFEPSHSEQLLEIFGHRTLRFESIDFSAHPFSGYVGIDRKLYEVREELRMVPGLPDIDLGHALEVCAGLGNLAGRALSDSLFPEGTKEREFQEEVVRALRMRPGIGEDLEQHPQTGGGIVDLSFHRIRIELKVVSDGRIGESEINKFVEQVAQYVVSSGKRIGVLCVLDSDKKTEPPSPVEEHLRIIRRQNDCIDVPIIFLCVKGGLARPSDLSR